MKNKLGLCFIGMNGTVATTTICGLELLKKKLVEDLCLLSEGYIDPDKKTIEMVVNSNRYLISRVLNLCMLDEIAIGGWDVFGGSVYSHAMNYKIIDKDLLKLVKDETNRLIPWSACSIEDLEQDNYLLAAKKVIRDIDKFRDERNVKNIVVINLQPTGKHIKLDNIHLNINDFEKALRNNHPLINTSMIYAYATIKAGASFIEFTPNTSIDVPALIDLANQVRVPIYGKDGKTGQTFIKSVLAQALKSRQLKIDGWFSTNILGNNDGKNLLNPLNQESKVRCKTKILSNITGYEITNHITNIVYYPPRGDRKEAWDNIDVTGFLGVPIQIKINLLGADSILAAPMIIDLARFSNYALEKRMGGFQTWLGLYFKLPLSDKINPAFFGFFEQEKMFVDFVLKEISTEEVNENSTIFPVLHPKTITHGK